MGQELQDLLCQSITYLILKMFLVKLFLNEYFVKKLKIKNYRKNIKQLITLKVLPESESFKNLPIAYFCEF